MVLDHIKAGKAMDIYRYLKLDKMDCQVAIIKNARSNKLGRKDILKIETDEIREEISAYAKKHGYDIIADSTILAFAKESYDVTDDILKSMGVDPAKRKEKAKKADAGK